MSTNAFSDLLEDDLGILFLTGESAGGSGTLTITGLLEGTAHENIHCGLVMSGINTGTQAIPATETALETGSIAEEIQATGPVDPTLYARVDVSSDTGVGAPTFNRISAGLFRNASAITFPQAGEDYDPNSAGLTVTHVIIMDSATLGAGNMLFWGALTSPREILDNDTFSFPANQLTIEFQ